MKKQSGMSLIEGLVALLLGSVLGLGTAVIAAKAMQANRDSNVQSLVTFDLRSWLQEQDVAQCTSNSTRQIADAVSLPMSCAQVDETYTVTALKADGAEVFAAENFAVTHKSASTLTNDVLKGAAIQVTP
ncbi:prepilin-type N-terminal cleavage/methylation domain-containing protein [Thauera sp. GDN1]|uniref:prepilin-type N-terminal cleavage/methylation domain-containing protein n=1 Tax=Thauera sp. GDN1 TaxID=2944810 RepID=UPI002479BE97|nr:prepilin-type N-terminal cleavage/methylation domain-containing protein [Thauera sp. GDN1]